MEAISMRARELRKNHTHAEMLVWQKVRNRQLGFKIVRQKPILIDYFGKKQAFIADFYCSASKLVIEIDGGIHSKQSNYDSLRTLLLNQVGIRLIRFTNGEIEKNFEDVMLRIKEELGGIVGKDASPLPLSTRGEG